MKFWMALPIGLALVFTNGHSVMAQNAQEFTQACQQDVVKHCATSISSPPALQACLSAKKNDLGDSCKKLLDGKK